MTGDHDQPYAPTPAVKVAAFLPVTRETLSDYGADGSWYGAYWRSREFNRLRHPNPFPVADLFPRWNRLCSKIANTWYQATRFTHAR